MTHGIHGHGVITNFVRCPAGSANVFFYRGEKVLECGRSDCKPAGDDWTDEMKGRK